MLNLDEVRKLVAALERDLARLESGSEDVQALRDEVEALRRVLNEPSPGQHGVKEGLERVHTRMDSVTETVKADAFKAGNYITAIGRMLGLS
jgi:hypothetical protein